MCEGIASVVLRTAANSHVILDFTMCVETALSHARIRTMIVHAVLIEAAVNVVRTFAFFTVG